MKLNIISCISGFMYLAYCLFNIESWVRSHTGEYICYAVIAWVLAMVFLWLRKGKSGKLLSLFFFAIGAIICLAGISIPCCTGG